MDHESIDDSTFLIDGDDQLESCYLDCQLPGPDWEYDVSHRRFFGPIVRSDSSGHGICSQASVWIMIMHVRTEERESVESIALKRGCDNHK